MTDPVSFARSLRHNQTPAERKFWAFLYQWRSAGWHFRRQAVIGPFVVDFVCKRARIIFEIDGDSHFTEAGLTQDARRTAYLAGLGYRVVRFGNDDVLENANGVGEVLFGLLGPVDGESPGWALLRRDPHLDRGWRWPPPNPPEGGVIVGSSMCASPFRRVRWGCQGTS